VAFDHLPLEDLIANRYGVTPVAWAWIGIYVIPLEFEFDSPQGQLKCSQLRKECSGVRKWHHETETVAGWRLVLLHYFSGYLSGYFWRRRRICEGKVSV
jgi:hypothetical protein